MKKRILFIDDEKDLCAKVKIFLSQKGFDVTTAPDGKKGSSLLKKEKFPLVITDIMMPDYDGHKILKFTQANIPDSLVIVVTGYASLTSAIDALREKAHDYILKPFDFNILLKSIDRAFEIISLKKSKAEAEKKLKDLATIDDLTGLFNQRYFFAVLSKEIQRAKRYNQPLSLMILDLDNFKHFNDTYGHIEGDKALRISGRTIKKGTRDIDSCYRYGGEEFSVIMPETFIDQALNVAKRVLSLLQNTKFSLQGLGNHSGNICITASIGVSEYKKNYSLEDFVRSSDAFTYQAKKLGKNRICYDFKNANC